MRTLTILVVALALAGSAWAIPPDASNHPRVARDISLVAPGTGYLVAKPSPCPKGSFYNDWLVKTDCPAGYSGPLSVPVVNGGRKYIYLFGGNSGSNSSTIYIYDIAANSWATSSVSMPEALSYPGGVSVGGRVYIFGGYASAMTNAVRIFNPADSSWTTGAPMSVACSDPVTFVYQDSLIFCCGGLTVFWTGFTNAVQIYNRLRNTWASGTVLPVQMGTGGGGVVGNTAVYSCGYNGSVSSTTYEGAINPANPTQITWTTGTDYPAGGRYRVTSGTLGNQVFVGNGGDMSANGYAQTYAYDPSTHAWTQFADKPTAMMNSRNYAIMDSTLYVQGGYDGTYLTAHEALNLRQLPHDVGVSFIRSPLAKEGPRTTIAPKVVYKNQGQNPETNIRVGSFVDSSGTILYRDSSLIASMAAGDTALVTFQNWTLGPMGATYTFTSWCRLAGDIDPTNDTLRQSVSLEVFRKVREIIGPPLPSGGAYQGLAWDGGDYLYWVRGQTSLVALVLKINKTTGVAVDSFNVNISGYPIGMTYQGGALWLGQFYPASQIHRVDLTGNILRSFSPGGISSSNLRGVSWNAAGNNLYLTHTGGAVNAGGFVEEDTLGAMVRQVAFGSTVNWGMAGNTRVRTDSCVLWISDDDVNQDLREVDVTGTSANLLNVHDVRADFPLGVYTGGSCFDGQYLYVGQVTSNRIIVYDLGITGVEAGGTTQPKPATYALGQAYPNPARGGVNISFSLPRDGKASLTVYNVLGQPVAALLNGAVKAGTKTVSWNARTAKGQLAPSGVYFYRLQAGAFSATRKLVIAR